MQLREACTFAAPPERVWELLFDPDAVAACLPGVRSLTAIADGEYRGEAAVRVGPFPVTLTVHVALKDRNPPHSCTLAMSVEGAGSSVNGKARLLLEEAGAGTRLLLEGEAGVGGLLTGLAGRGAGDAASRFLRDFFACLQARAQQCDPRQPGPLAQL